MSVAQINAPLVQFRTATGNPRTSGQAGSRLQCSLFLSPEKSLCSTARNIPCVLRRSVAVSAEAQMWGENLDYNDSDYIALGLAQCFVKDADSKLEEVLVIEPIPAAALECMDNGGVTSYLHVVGSNLGVSLKQDPTILPAEFHVGRFCDEFEYRALCASRTWKRPHPQEKLMNLVPVGAMRSDFNFSLEDKRVLNFERTVSDSDNIKQDISIDVYGRKDEEEGKTVDKEIEKLYQL